jgi:hypothetical protein
VTAEAWAKLTRARHADIITVAPFFGHVKAKREQKARLMMDENPLDTLAATAAAGARPAPVMMQGSSAQRVEAGQVHLQGSAAGVIRSQAARIEESAVALALAGAVDAQDSAFGLLVAREATLRESGAPLLVAGTLHTDKAQALVVAAGRVDGDVQAVFTWQSALALGVGLGMTLVGAALWWSRRTVEK